VEVADCAATGAAQASSRAGSEDRTNERSMGDLRGERARGVRPARHHPVGGAGLPAFLQRAAGEFLTAAVANGT
jgi:hypothetical protein